jgi:hypothetical protein
MPKLGPAIYLGAEDDKDEIHIQCECYGRAPGVATIPWRRYEIANRNSATASTSTCSILIAGRKMSYQNRHQGTTIVASQRR